MRTTNFFRCRSIESLIIRIVVRSARTKPLPQICKMLQLPPICKMVKHSQQALHPSEERPDHKTKMTEPTQRKWQSSNALSPKLTKDQIIRVKRDWKGTTQTSWLLTVHTPDVR